MIHRGRPAPEFVAQLQPTGNNPEDLLAELRRVLASGRVRPGAVLPVDGIARAFGVSRTPVREALKMLLAEGLIRHDHRGGYIVHGLFLVGAPLRLWEMFGARGVVPAALEVVGGLVWAHRGRAVLARRADGDDGTVLGLFLVSRKRVPESVRNWFG